MSKVRPPAWKSLQMRMHALCRLRLLHRVNIACACFTRWNQDIGGFLCQELSITKKLHLAALLH